MLGSVEHAVKLLIGRDLPIVGNRRETALLALCLKREPAVDPLFAEWDTKFLGTTMPAVSTIVFVLAAPPFRSLRNDRPDRPGSSECVREFPVCHGANEKGKAQTAATDRSSR